jgi:hypothetical protein
MNKQICSIKMKKKENKLVIAPGVSMEQYRLFLMSLKEDDTVEALFELRTEDNTKGQLAKIHVCIKELADEQGHSIKEMKNIVKKECGMAWEGEDGKECYQSFAGCSKDELSSVIETIIQMGNFMGVNFGTIQA